MVVWAECETKAPVCVRAVQRERYVYIPLDRGSVAELVEVAEGGFSGVIIFGYPLRLRADASKMVGRAFIVGLGGAKRMSDC